MHMRSSVVVFAISLALSGCAAQPQGDSSAGAGPGPQAGAGMMCGPGGMRHQGMAAQSPAQLAQMDERMRAMQDAHARMMAARTPDERRALMAEHRKAMREGMAAIHGATGRGPCMSPEMMQRHQGMMEMMMQMMSETPDAPAPTPPAPPR